MEYCFLFCFCSDRELFVMVCPDCQYVQNYNICIHVVHVQILYMY
jgi:hypothetical protein